MNNQVAFYHVLTIVILPDYRCDGMHHFLRFVIHCQPSMIIVLSPFNRPMEIMMRTHKSKVGFTMHINVRDR